MWLIPLYILVGWVPPAFLPGWTQNTVPGAGGLIHNPLAIKPLEPFLQGVANASNVVIGAAFALAIASLFARYRRAGAEERQQLKFFTYAAVLAPLAFVLYPVYSGPDANTPIGITALVVASIGIDGLPIAMGLAIVKYRLYDIDIVINRTLVYGALAAFITAIYVGIVVGIGNLVGSGGQPNLLLSIVATAVVAVAFQPVRERLQKVANRLVYGKRGDAVRGAVAVLRPGGRDLRRRGVAAHGTGAGGGHRGRARRRSGFVPETSSAPAVCLAGA